MCNCRRRNNRESCRKLIDSGLITCCEGLAECQAGLDAIRDNNITRGLREVRNGQCLCQQGLNCCRRGIVNGGFQNRDTCSGLRECSQALCDMSFGCCEVRCNNVSDGIEDITESIVDFEQGLNRIKSGLESIDNSISSCQTANSNSSTNTSTSVGTNASTNNCDSRVPSFYSARPRLVA